MNIEPSFPRRREPSDIASRKAALACGALLAYATSAFAAQDGVRVLDGFDDPTIWRVVTSNQVSGALRQVDGVDGKAMCLDYDFNGVSGHAGIQRDLPMAYPANYQFGFQLRGDSPRNDLQFKVIDASGDNVWWVNRPKYEYPTAWTPVRYKQRHIDKAWGPDPDRVLRRSTKLEFTVYNNAGGKGSVCFDQLTFQPLPVDDGTPLTGKASASVAFPAGAAALAIDGKADTAWSADLHGDKDPQLTLDLGKPREFGGLVLRWKPEQHASDYLVQLSDDGVRWRDARTVVDGNGGNDYLALPESEARYVRLTIGDGPGRSFALAELEVKPLAFAAHPNDLIKAMAAESPKGWFPRGFSGEQPYWTIVGLDGGREQGLIGEDGAIEIAKGGVSVEPFVQVDGRWIGWSDVQATQSLQDRYLPMPTVAWKHPDFALTTTAFAAGRPGDSRVVARHRLTNTGKTPREYVLALAVQPWQVNPPSQFLNTTGGFSPINDLAVRDGVVSVNGRASLRFATPDAALASRFDEGLIRERLATMGDTVDGTAVQVAGESTGLASAAVLYRITLAAGESRDIDWVAPLEGALPAKIDAARDQQATAAMWRGKLGEMKLQVPVEGQPVADTLRTALAHMLISRIGPRLQPGTRSYSRSWIRDGAMISEGLLRLGRPEVVKEYVEWYAPYQFKNGKVPCCVDDRGSDPVPENDSHGELIFNVAEYYRYTGDKAFLRRMWPHVQGAFAYMEELRLSERTEANRAVNAAFYGMMPASISHEGYSAKPMHSYWDNFWALRGYKDAVEVADALGQTAESKRMAASRDEFRDDLYASLQAATKLHGIAYLPGAAEIGDFDPTSTTIALAPGGEQGKLPADLLHGTFERYWTEFVQRRDGQREWKDYTPYEWRNVAAFVRLGWRERAWDVLDFFFKDRAPQPWNQWAEVVSRTPRTPFFVGDLPHAWVASDFVRSALDMFAYSRELDDSLVLAAGVPATWLDGEGIAIDGLRTPNGVLGYSLRKTGGEVVLEAKAGLKLPPGGLVLPWPYKDAPGETRINGKPAQWTNGELRITTLPAKVSIRTR
ncbi:discoidin domain-containing protein [Pseudoxanthomonas japonensis]|uniref:Coagulation factor 5/8 type domain-containing protein n=1 Tax=Pseudoxanthomonas japonensis TaxID=69284 RepID=A0ABQ6ZII4_9GAMM|nr:discoidin domain-containing protein [Pseudoxanthomonas japonensis]KAF1725809.1 coagulation factor 5/8 type domain-containing protein [Pseudoxanthomonas japonensis]